MTLRIRFNNLDRQYRDLRQEILDATDTVLRSGQVMTGNYTAELENWLCKRNDVRYAVTCHSGTQALEIIAHWYRQLYVRHCPRVLVPSLTYPATVNAFVSRGWQVQLADTDQHGLMDLAQVSASSLDAVVMIGLYGNAIDDPYRRGKPSTKPEVLVIEDAAQHWLANDAHRIGVAAAISFDPTKNFNSYGNGGAILTNDSALCYHARAVRDNGKPLHTHIGTNSRISEVDAAQLMVKTGHLDRWQQRRKTIADYWINRFRSSKIRCLIDKSNFQQHCFHKFVIDVDHRDQVRQRLESLHIETRVHYEKPCHELPVFAELAAPDLMSRSSALSRRVLSLPIYPELTDLEVEYIADQLLDCVIKAG